MDLLLEIVEGPQAGRQISLTNPVELGRDASASVQLDDGQVSRRHARVELDAHGAVAHDLGSTNGTYVNDQPMGASQRLVPGDRIRVGLTVLELRSAEQVARRASAVMATPDITQLDRDILQPVPAQQLVAVDQAPGVPGFLVEESEPAFVSRSIADSGGAAPGTGPDARGQDYAALARLVDGRVKSQTNTAAFAVLAIVGLAVLVYFGAR
ncbi:MAG: hypothetical protein QOE06_1034 [Thermoleophilaceae bacterium]|jgi:pSer/pThr/pTyr-binding forkhead associated (FHA) protein|nr:hypothetical protein [Thermoleophilaceae bacterium]